MQKIKATISTQERNRNIGNTNLLDTTELELTIQSTDIWENPVFELHAQKADKKFIRQLEGMTISDKTNKIITILLEQDMVTCNGIVAMQLLIKDSGRTSTTFFYINVGRSLDRKIIQSIQNVKVLEDLDKYVENAYANLTEYEQRLSQIVASNIEMEKQESIRQEQEKSRQVAEETRNTTFNKSQVDRAQSYNLSEDNRNNNYSIAEDARNDLFTTGEQNRQQIFTQNESSRESAFIESENTRNNTFTLAQQSRQQEFNTSEALRFNTFNANEKNRESEFNLAEETRELVFNDAETNRNSEEVNRIKREKQRQTDEKQRNTNEISRQTSMQNIENRFNEIEKEPTKVEVEEARADFYNNIHLSLQNRLTKDFSKIHNELNNAKLIDVAGENISINHTYDGYTEELEISGNTYQNIINILEPNVNLPYTVSDGRRLWFGSNLVKPLTKYTYLIEITQNNSLNPVEIISGYTNCFTTTHNVEAGKTGIFKLVLTTQARVVMHRISSVFCTNGTVTINKIALIEGDYANVDIPFLTGIESVGEAENNKISILSKNKNLFNGVLNKVDRNYFVTDIELKKGQNISLLFNCKNISSSEKRYHICSSIFTGGNKKDNILYSSNFQIGENKINNINVIDDGILTIYSVASSSTVELKMIQVEEGIVLTEFTPQKLYNKDILCPYPLRRLPNNIADIIKGVNNNVFHTKKIEKYRLTGNENWLEYTNFTSNTLARVQIPTNEILINNNGGSRYSICNKIKMVVNYNDTGEEHYYFDRNFVLILDRTKFESATLNGLKKYLSTAEIDIYYELEIPIVTPLNIQNIDLQIFREITYITSDNYIKPTISCKVPVNINAVLVDLKEENSLLKQQVYTLETSNTDLAAGHGQQEIKIELANAAIDFLMFASTPVKNIIKGGSNMAAYIASRIITKGEKDISAGQEYYRKYLSLPAYSCFKKEVDLILISEGKDYLIIEI